MTTQAMARQEIQIGEGVGTATLLVLLILSITGSIQAADWTDGLGIITWSGLGGLALGALLAKLGLRGIFAHLLMLVGSVPAVAWLTSFLLPSALSTEERFLILADRVVAWTTKVVAGKEGSDALIFVMQLGVVFWIIGYVSAWFVYRRHQVWGAIAPTGAAIVVNIFYAAPQSGLYLGLYLLCALLLLVRLNLHALESWWRRAAIGYAADISFDFLFYGALFAILLIMLAWLLPGTAPGPSWLSVFEPLQEPWQGIEDEFTRVFNTLRAVGRPSTSAFFGTTLMMGGPVNLGQRPVMDIQSYTGRYWRATVYDKYTGIGWLSTHLDALNLSANDPRLDAARDFLRVEVTQTVKIYATEQNILYAAAQPVRFDIPIEIRFGRPLASDSSPAFFDLTVVRARRPPRAGDTYNVVSAITAADEDSLRADSTRYSEWISATYLQLPDDLPARVRNLAKNITDQYGNPYDKASAIERYVRAKIKYNEKVSAPPANRDGVDYTLFDRTEGYCNYYASAFVVLARAVGIPARVAAGYTLGEYEGGTFHIVEADAHSWAEVYFPNYGWIEFEPTASKPEIVRPTKAQAAPSSPELDEAAEARRRQREKDFPDDEMPSPGAAPLVPFWTTLLNDPRNLTVIAGGSIALLIAAALAAREIRNARRMSHLSAAARVYETMLSRARWLGVREQMYATPFERAQAIDDALPRARGETGRIAAFYTRERFGAHELDAVERAALSVAWDKWQAAWWSGVTARAAGRVVAPPRRFAARARRVVERIRNLKS
jgi:transglutaminase-like putative cysteine protease